MSVFTTNFALGKGVDADNAEVYLTVTLAAALDTIDTNLRSVTGGFTVQTGNLTVTAGTAGIGIGPVSQVGLNIAPALTGATTQYGIYGQPTGGSGGTAEITGVAGQPSTSAVAYTATLVTDFHALNPIKGAGSTITAAVGVKVDAITTGNTDNIGVDIAVPSGGSGVNLGLRNAGGASLNGSGTSLAFFGVTPAVKQTVVGAKGGNAALGSLLPILAQYGLITDSSTA